MITSADGTTIGYRTTGTGPGLLVVHDVMDTSHVYEELADELASDFTVHVIDRRGRGESGPHRAGHGLLAEVEDVWAVLEATGAERVCGVGSGAVIALEAALRLSGITHVAAYEPPVNAPARQRKVIARYEREMADGQHIEALVTLFKGLDLAPRWLRMMPRRLLSGVIRKAGESEPDDELELLLPTVRHDVRVAEEGSRNLERFRALRSQVLLLGGTKSARHFRDGLYRLGELLPNAEKILVEEADHGSPAEHPRLVVPALKGFF